MPWFFDFWSWAHAVLWFWLAVVATIAGMRPRTAVLVVVAVGLCWELAELSIIEPWLHFHEPWYNRWVSDILIDAGGAIAGAWAGQFWKDN